MTFASGVHPPPPPQQLSMKVNVRLCGSIPRQDMITMMDSQFVRPSNELHSRYMSSTSTSTSSAENSSPTASLDASHVHDSLSLLTSALQHQQDEDDQNTRLCHSQQHQHSIMSASTSAVRKPPTFEAPTWAVPACGETRLEPIGDCADLQGPIDLKSQAVFRVGRSPQSDVQLLHATSSRRHAMLFHHSNGSCYLIDCGSAHGTYINGSRVESTPTNGVVVPHKVRRGSLVRFGGPGAPTFMLKSFNFELDDMITNTAGESSQMDTVPSFVAMQPVSTPVMTAVVERNTRLNSLGKTAKQSLFLQQQLLSSKRSFDSMETMPLLDSDDCDSHMSSSCSSSSSSSNLRCSSPPLSPEQAPIRLVSPADTCDSESMSSGPRFSNKRRRVTFSQEPPMACYPTLVSPDVSSDEQEHIINNNSNIIS